MVRDTGLFDLSVSADYASKEIINCLTMAEGGIHALIFVLSARARISQEEESTLHTLHSIFGSEIFDYMIVVFTGGDELEWNKKSLDDYLRESCPEFLTRVLNLSGSRKVLFNNRTKDEGKKAKQLNQLLAHVAAIRDNNFCKPYTDNMNRFIEDECYRLWEYDEKLRYMAQMLEEKLLWSSTSHERAICELGYAEGRPPQYFPVYHPSPRQIIRPPQYFPVYRPPPQQMEWHPQDYSVYPPFPHMGPMEQPPECNIM